jgi:hypothetical protein
MVKSQSCSPLVMLARRTNRNQGIDRCTDQIAELQTCNREEGIQSDPPHSGPGRDSHPYGYCTDDQGWREGGCRPDVRFPGRPQLGVDDCGLTIRYWCFDAAMSALNCIKRERPLIACSS